MLLRICQIPPRKLAGALSLIALICLSFWYLLHLKWAALETHLLAHAQSQPSKGKRRPPTAAIGLTLLFPLSALVAILLVLPLLVFITDHAPYQNLTPIRPDHYWRLFYRVYAAWLGSAEGKLKEKDM